MPTVLNAANEVAVAAFLAGKIPFLAIEDCIEKALTRHQLLKKPSLADIQEVDKDTGDTSIQYSHKVVCS